MGRFGCRAHPYRGLDGAKTGKPVNAPLIREMIEEIGEDAEIEVGGGIRTLDQIEAYLDAGVRYAVIGTAAVKTPGFLKEACAVFTDSIIVALDAKDGIVATDGWVKSTGHDVIDLAQRFEDYGVSAFLYTDIARDGMLSGVNVEATAALARAVSVPVIASGGMHTLDDVRALLQVEKTASWELFSAAVFTRAPLILPKPKSLSASND